MGSEQQRKLRYLILVSLFLISMVPAAGAQIRLAGTGSSPCSGRVEIYHSGSWGTVCDDLWDLKDAEVVCRQMGCGTALEAPKVAHFGQGTGQIWLDDVGCSGSETSLTMCEHNGFGEENCGHGEDAGVICSVLRTAGSGSTPCSGRVEIIHSGAWGTVCDNSWDLNDAEVVCRQLSCGAAQAAPLSAHFGQGTGQIWLDAVACSGSESSLTACPHGGFGTNNCGHGDDASVVCKVNFPKPTISMSTAGEITWGQSTSITCTISTQHLGGTFILEKTTGSFRQTKTSSTNSAVFTISKVTFDNEGLHQCQYQIIVSSYISSSNMSDSVSISVGVPMQQPSISLSSPHTVLVSGPTGVEFTRGSSFVITCSISTYYPGGVFFLKLSGSNVNTQPPAENSAAFSFPAAEPKHQGSYSCVYEVTLSSRKFTSSETATIKLVMKAWKQVVWVMLRKSDSSVDIKKLKNGILEGLKQILNDHGLSQVPHGKIIHNKEKKKEATSCG